jgi:hypothetical protein
MIRVELDYLDGEFRRYPDVILPEVPRVGDHVAVENESALRKVEKVVWYPASSTVCVMLGAHDDR